MAPKLSDNSADKTADQIEKNLKGGGGLDTVRTEIEKVRKDQGSDLDKEQFKAWMQKVEDRLHKDGILPKLEITFDNDKVDLTGISGDGKPDGKGDRVKKAGPDGRFQFDYDKNGELTAVKDSKGEVAYTLKDGKWSNGKDDSGAELAVDSRGNLRIMHTDGTESVYRRTGAVTEHDNTGRVTTQTGSDGRVRKFEYNENGEVASYTESDKNGEVTSQAKREADGTFIATAAGADGKIGTADDETSKLKNIEIDAKESLKITNQDGSYMEQRGLGAKLYYDKTERLVELTTTNGKKYHYEYNGDGKEPVALTITQRGEDGKWGTAEEPGDDKVEATFKVKNGEVTATNFEGKETKFKGSIAIDERGRAVVTDDKDAIETTFGLSGAIKVKTQKTTSPKSLIQTVPNLTSFMTAIS